MNQQDRFLVLSELIESLEWVGTQDDGVNMLNEIFEQMETCSCSDLMHDLFKTEQCLNNENLQAMYQQINRRGCPQPKRLKSNSTTHSVFPPSFEVWK